MKRPITGYHVFFGFVLAFGAIIAVNVFLAVRAVQTFPGLEVRNSYVASQRFEADRAAQSALGWEVEAKVTDGWLRLAFAKDGRPVAPRLVHAVLGRATHIGEDREPDFVFDGAAFVAPVELAPGNWNLRIAAEAQDGTLFRRRIVLRVAG